MTMPGMSKITSFTLAYALLLLFGATGGTRAADSFLDFTFGGSGEVTTDVGGQDTARAVAIQADGRIVVAGESSAAAALVEQKGSNLSMFEISIGTRNC